jgi:hypothetical protein
MVQQVKISNESIYLTLIIHYTKVHKMYVTSDPETSHLLSLYVFSPRDHPWTLPRLYPSQSNPH